MAREACASSGECGVPEEPVRRQALRPQREVAQRYSTYFGPAVPGCCCLYCGLASSFPNGFFINTVYLHQSILQYGQNKLFRVQTQLILPS